MRYIIIAGVSFIFAITSFTQHGYIHPPCPGNQGSINPTADYYNLQGALVKKASPRMEEQRIVLTRSASIETIDSLIKIGYVIKVPTIEILDSLDSCFQRSDRLDHEHCFAVGKRDKVSIIVKGKRRSLDTSHRWKYFNNLTSKKDIAAYDVHAHPYFRIKEKDTFRFGDAIASPTDQLSYDIREFKPYWKYIQPSIILGYEPPKNSNGEYDASKTLLRYVGFYNYCNRNIDTIQLDVFKTLVHTLLNKKTD